MEKNYPDYCKLWPNTFWLKKILLFAFAPKSALEIRPLAALYPPPQKKYRRHEYTAPGDYWERRQLFKTLFLYGGGGYNAVRGLGSRDSTPQNLIIQLLKSRLVSRYHPGSNQIKGKVFFSRLNIRNYFLFIFSSYQY